MASFSNLQARASLAAQSTALHDAADAGDIASVTDLLRNGADANARAERRFFDEGATALHLASQKGHLEVALALLQAGAELSGRAAHCKKYDNGDNGGVRYNGEWEGDLTPLHLASAYGHVAVVRALVSAGGRTEWIASGNKVEVNLPVDDSGEAFFREHDGGQTPLHLASAYGHAEVVRALAEAGAHVRAWGGACNDTPLHLASASGHVEAMAALLEAGADVDGGDEVGNTALHFVADVDSLELLLSAGANPNLVAESSYGSGTPLGSFCTLIHRLETDEKGMQNATAQVEVLLRHGADTSIPASGEFPEGASPVLSCAAKNGVPGIVSALLSAGLAPNERDKRGWAPLHDAAQGDHVEVVRLLLRAGAEKDAPTARGGWTPLHVACRFTSVACALELLRWGADLAAETGVDSDDDAWSSPLVLDRRRVDVSKGFGKTPAQVIGLKNLAAAAAAAVHGGSADPSLDEDEQMEMFDGENRTQHSFICSARAIFFCFFVPRRSPAENARDCCYYRVFSSLRPSLFLPFYVCPFLD